MKDDDINGYDNNHDDNDDYNDDDTDHDYDHDNDHDNDEDNYDYIGRFELILSFRFQQIRGDMLSF